MAICAGHKFGHYEVLSQLGAGGMGEVYRAHDTLLNRCVAIKVLPPRLAEDAKARERLRREAMAAAALDDPFICKIFEIGESEGVTFIVMEFVPGETLRARLASGRLSAAEALRIAGELAEALEDAHAKHFVHRDLKPANVMLTPQGHIKVMDFGLAKLVRVAAGDATVTALTEPGAAIGTLSYMSPEQLRGEAVDQRSDLFSFGIVLSEMLSGANPFQRATALETTSAILRDAPNLPEALPEDLTALLERLLSKSVSERYPSISEVRADLSRALAGLAQPMVTAGRTPPRFRRAYLAVAGALLAAIAGGIYWASSRGVPRVASLAVLPFEVEGNEPETAILGDGLSDDIINSLTRLPGIKVISRMSSSRFKGNRDDPKAVGKALDVQALLVAGMSRRGSNLLMRVELINAADQSRMWGARYDRPIGELIEIKRDILHGVTRMLAVDARSARAASLGHRPSDDPEAYRLFLMGQQFMIGNQTEMRRAAEYLEKAVALEPRYALARATLAAVYLILAEHGLGGREVNLNRARAEVRSALAIDADLGEAHSVTGKIALLERRWDAAGASFRKALELNPSSLDVHLNYAPYLGLMGRMEESLGVLFKARELDPLSVVAAHALAIGLLISGDPDGAVAEFERAISLNPNWTWGRIKLGVAYTHKGMCGEALKSASTAEDALRQGDTPLARAWLGYVYGICGAKDRAHDALKDLEKWPAAIREDPLKEATIHAGLRDKEKVMQMIEKATALKGIPPGMIVVFPRLFWPELEREAGIRKIVQRLGLPLSVLSPER